MTRRVEALRAEQRAPHLVQSLGTGEVEGRGWIAFEYLEGGSLQDLIEAQGPFAPGWAVRYACEVARALARLHEAGVFHRDVKPANLLLGSDGKVRLGDFGLSRDLSGKLSTAGSPAFAAPEMIAGNVRDGRRADVYSLGATLSFLLTGVTCHPGHPDVFAFEACGVPGPLQLVLVAAMARAPEKRTATVEELLAALEELELPLEDADHVSAPEGPWRQTGPGSSPAPVAADAPSEGAAQTAGGSSWWSSARARRRGLVGVSGLGLMILVTGAAAWLAGGRSAAIEVRLEEPIAGVEVSLGGHDLGALVKPKNLRLAPGEHTLEVRRDNVAARSVVAVEPGQPQVVMVRVQHPLRVEGGEGVMATVRDSRGEVVRARAGWLLEGHPAPFEVALPQGRYQVAFHGPDHHRRSLELSLGKGGERVQADLRPVLRFGVRVPDLEGFWSEPLLLDVDSDGVQDLLLNGYEAGAGELVAISGRDGRVLWRFLERTNRWAMPVLAPKGEVAIGVLVPSEEPGLGVAQAVFLDPKDGKPLRRVSLGLSTRAPISPTRFEIGGERGLFFVVDCQQAPPWRGARLSAVREDGEVLWQREEPAGDGKPSNRYSLFACGIDRDGDGADETVLWEVGGRIQAFAPGAKGEVYWRSDPMPFFMRKLYWRTDFDEVLVFGAWPDGGPPRLVALDVRGKVLWRRLLKRGTMARRLPWIQLDGEGPRELMAPVRLGASAELLVFDAAGNPLAERRFDAEEIVPAGVFRVRGGRYLAVQTLFPARVELLDPKTLASVWVRKLGVTRATLSVVDLDGSDSLVVSYRDGRVEVLDPDLPE